MRKVKYDKTNPVVGTEQSETTQKKMLRYDKTNLLILRGFSHAGHFAVVHCPSPGYFVFATKLQKKDVKI